MNLRILYVCNEYLPAPHAGIGTFVQTLGQYLSQHVLRYLQIVILPTQFSTLPSELGD